MKIVVAPNAFKEAAGPLAVAQAMARGCRRAVPDAEIVLCPMADGGDGTAEALVAALRGIWIESAVTGPMGGTVTARWAVLPDTNVAIIEMAAASGLKLMPKALRDPLRASTYGVGELIVAAIRRGCHEVVVGLGGSATVDGGTGMARALGYRFLDPQGKEIPEGGGHLRDLSRIVRPDDLSGVESVRIVAATDVENPLVGATGAARVFAPQKGATPEVVAVLERGLTVLAERIEQDLGARVADIVGGGSAGGLAVGLVAFAGGEIRPGAALVAEQAGLDAALGGADVAITGEGRLDLTTLRGKAPYEVARLGRVHGVPIIALAGSVDPAATEALGAWFVDCAPIAPAGMPTESAIARTAELLEIGAESAIRRFLSGGGGHRRR